MIDDTSPCTVERKCSSTGKTCSVDDRACQSAAIASGLEVTCEKLVAADGSVALERSYVCCPPAGEQRDSSVVWILLAFAVGVTTSTTSPIAVISASWARGPQSKST